VQQHRDHQEDTGDDQQDLQEQLHVIPWALGECRGTAWSFPTTTVPLDSSTAV
jgi:hypothetical protein